MKGKNTIFLFVSFFQMLDITLLQLLNDDVVIRVNTYLAGDSH